MFLIILISLIGFFPKHSCLQVDCILCLLMLYVYLIHSINNVFQKSRLMYFFWWGVGGEKFVFL